MNIFCLCPNFLRNCRPVVDFIQDPGDEARARSQGIPCWVDFWGHDVNHDWVWWRRQMPYYLSHLV
ncbi:MAG: hypothetical protein HY922_05155 [Elusimicrobia bacterium]|nr:hypothetical protein [Elusimicrobiota bacterium]